jgi:outer membrane lipoprotein-sorting protein
VNRALVFSPLALAALLAAAPASALTQAEVDAVVERLDVRQRNSGDYKALAYIEQKERGKNDLFYQSVFYRRDADDKLMILFLKPKSEAGKGYLRLDKNLFMYDPTVGKWERRTERERIMGTDSRRQDFDESRLAEEYAATFVGDEKLGAVPVHHIELKAREGQDVAYPTLQIWVDQETGNLLKRQDLALSGRLMRTTYYPKWKKVFSESKNADVYYPEEIHIFDEVEKGNRTTVAITEVDLRPLSENIFTKAWLESKSR